MNQLNRRASRAISVFTRLALLQTKRGWMRVSPRAFSAASTRMSWYIDQQSARYARRNGLDSAHGVPAHFAVDQRRAAPNNYYWLSPSCLDSIEYRARVNGCGNIS